MFFGGKERGVGWYSAVPVDNGICGGLESLSVLFWW